MNTLINYDSDSDEILSVESLTKNIITVENKNSTEKSSDTIKNNNYDRPGGMIR